MSTVFVWKRTSSLTTNWHNGGGLVVRAESLDEARDLMRGTLEEGVDDYEGNPREKCGAYTTDPDIEFTAEGGPLVLVFPDAGCC